MTFFLLVNAAFSIVANIQCSIPPMCTKWESGHPVLCQVGLTCIIKSIFEPTPQHGTQHRVV